MASTIVYGTPTSPAVARVLACLLEKDVDFQIKSLDMRNRQHKSPEYLKIHPFGQIPGFEDEDVKLFESRAICRYICDKYADKGTKGLLGNNLLERASIEQWIEAEAQNYSPPSTALLTQLVVYPMRGMEQEPAVIEQNEAKLNQVLDVYEKRLGESRFLAGDEFTLADLSHLPNSDYLVGRTDKGHLLTSRKNVGRWWEEISSRPSWKKVLELKNAPPS